jgi:hypothetical protein
VWPPSIMLLDHNTRNWTRWNLFWLNILTHKSRWVFNLLRNLFFMNERLLNVFHSQEAPTLEPLHFPPICCTRWTFHSKWGKNWSSSTNWKLDSSLNIYPLPLEYYGTLWAWNMRIAHQAYVKLVQWGENMNRGVVWTITLIIIFIYKCKI